ncbi:hypothetical protein BGZ92_009625 [Podila epicladia]|nr:hypothetical protein BGZ92_009625 [Podila epicladia]
MTAAQIVIPAIIIPPIPSISFSIPPIPSISFSIPPIPSITFRSIPDTTIPPNPAINSLPKTTETVPPVDVPNNNCLVCIGTNIQSVPACQALTNFNPDTTLTSEQKACYCSLLTDFSWFQKCKGPDSCSDSQISSMEQNYTKARGTFSCVTPLEQASSTSLTLSQCAIGIVLTTLITAMLL